MCVIKILGSLRQAGNTSWLFMVATAALIAFSAWLYDFGKLNGVDELADTREEKRELQQKLKFIDSERKTVQQKLAVYERSEQIDVEAKQNVRQEMATLQSEILDLRKEIELYRGIFSPKDNTPGLRVQNLEIEQADLPNRYHFVLTLTQVIKNSRKISGTVHLEVLGDEDGHSALLIFRELGQGEKKSLKFGFRYFQHVNGEIRLPRHFQPRLIRVKVKLSGKKSKVIEREYVWPVAKTPIEAANT
ncbi:MAG: DUF6776 family protein [Gammaproteobacteria bacterium]